MCWFSELAALAKSWHMNWCTRLWALRSRRKSGIFDGSRRLMPLKRNAAGRMWALYPKPQAAEIESYRKVARENDNASFEHCKRNESFEEPRRFRSIRLARLHSPQLDHQRRIESANRRGRSAWGHLESGDLRKSHCG